MIDVIEHNYVWLNWEYWVVGGRNLIALAIFNILEEFFTVMSLCILLPTVVIKDQIIWEKSSTLFHPNVRIKTEAPYYYGCDG